MSDLFWNRWRREYVTNISLRQQWYTPIWVGDIVVIKEKESSRNERKLVKVFWKTIWMMMDQIEESEYRLESAIYKKEENTLIKRLL